jgi:formylglycine-generating enzyme required for sulfatase activity
MSAALLALALSAAPPRSEVAALAEADEGRLRVQVASLLARERGHPEAARCLLLLCNLGRSCAAPAAPAFPFSPDEARRYQRAYARWAGLPVEVTIADGQRFVLVPPGRFRMGSPPGERGRKPDEAPVTVTLTRPLYLGKHELTRGAFARFAAATGHVTDAEKRGGGHAHDDRAVWIHRPGTSWRRPGYAGAYAPRDDHPVVHVSYNDALAYCRWLGGRFTLPTEAQWEWACRGGSAGAYWWGDEPDTTGLRLNLGDLALKRTHASWPRKTLAMDDGHAFAAPVGTYRPNGWGLCDTLGNVWEWCSTRYGPFPRGPLTDPGDLDPKRGLAVRGGGWSNEPHDGRCAARNADPPAFAHSNLGVRLALPLPPLDQPHPRSPHP